MPRTEIVTETTQEGGYNYNVKVARLTQDEQDRSLIRRELQNTRHIERVPDYLRALSRVGDIRRADFPVVTGQRYDGTHKDGLDKDDAFMSGNRPFVLLPGESTQERMADWLLGKIEAPTRKYMSLDPQFDDNAHQKSLRERYERLLKIAHETGAAHQQAKHEIERDAQYRARERGVYDPEAFLHGGGSEVLDEIRSGMVQKLDGLGEQTLQQLKDLLEVF